MVATYNRLAYALGGTETPRTRVGYSLDKVAKGSQRQIENKQRLHSVHKLQ